MSAPRPDFIVLFRSPGVRNVFQQPVKDNALGSGAEPFRFRRSRQPLSLGDVNGGDQQPSE
jgi:hypothetical protein